MPRLHLDRLSIAFLALSLSTACVAFSDLSESTPQTSANNGEINNGEVNNGEVNNGENNNGEVNNGESNNGAECETAVDCADGETCLAGDCVDECENHRECAPNEFCLDDFEACFLGECDVEGTGDPYCRVEDDCVCPPDLLGCVCTNANPCRSDEDCLDLELRVCHQGRCYEVCNPANDGCPTNRVCMGGLCLKGCQEDLETCLANEKCEGPAGQAFCQPTCMDDPVENRDEASAAMLGLGMNRLAVICPMTADWYRVRVGMGQQLRIDLVGRDAHLLEARVLFNGTMVAEKVAGSDSLSLLTGQLERAGDVLIGIRAPMRPAAVGYEIKAQVAD